MSKIEPNEKENQGSNTPTTSESASTIPDIPLAPIVPVTEDEMLKKSQDNDFETK
jgi:hypothetical protein